MAQTAESGFNMASESLVGQLLRTLVASKPAGRFLEVGTGTGIGAAWMLDGMDAASTLVSVDVNPVSQQIARDVLGGDSRLELILQDALQYLRSSATPVFDLVFADALPGKYDGLSDALAVVKPGEFYVIDDLLPQPNWPPGHAAKVPVLQNALASNPALRTVSMDWASGVMVVVKK